MPIVQKACTSSPIAQKASRSNGSTVLTKNALQNVMQYFKPWGRDFIVLRSVNKRMLAAYHDHLKTIVNIDQFMARVAPEAENKAYKGVKSLLKFAAKG